MGHNYDYQVQIFGFDKATRHSNTPTFDVAIANQQMTHSTMILMTKHFCLPNAMSCTWQYCQLMSKVPSHRPTEEDHTFLVCVSKGCDRPITIQLSLDGFDSYLKAWTLASWSIRMSWYLSIILHLPAHNVTPQPCFILLKRTTWLSTEDVFWLNVPQDPVVLP